MPKTHSRTIAVTVLLVLFSLSFMWTARVLSESISARGHENWSTTHKGSFTSVAGVTYNALIDECDHGDGRVDRIMHLYPEGYASYVSITGHDYDRNGIWDRIFYCCYFTNPDGTSTGCNSVLHVRGSGSASASNWEWEPCPGDAGRAVQFTDAQIAFAQGELDQALHAVYNEEHLMYRMVRDEVEQRCVDVFPPRIAKGVVITPTTKE